MDYGLQILKRIEGIKSPPFFRSKTKSSITQQGYGFVNWIKGNHQSALINTETYEEVDRAPLFGTVNDYSDYIPLLSAYSHKNWIGYCFHDKDYLLSWIKDGKPKHAQSVYKVIPEARSVYGLHFTADGQHIVALIGSSQEFTQSTILLVVLAFTDTFPLTDFRRVPLTTFDFMPSLTVANQTKDDGLTCILNTGKQIKKFNVENSGRISEESEVEDLSFGTL